MRLLIYLPDRPGARNMPPMAPPAEAAHVLFPDARRPHRSRVDRMPGLRAVARLAAEVSVRRGIFGGRLFRMAIRARAFARKSHRRRRDFGHGIVAVMADLSEAIGDKPCSQRYIHGQRADRQHGNEQQMADVFQNPNLIYPGAAGRKGLRGRLCRRRSAARQS